MFKFLRQKPGIVDQLKSEALAGAAKDHNHIRVTTKEDRSGVVLMTHADGRDLAWITYNASQLDDLITLLESARAGLSKRS